ncbi:hypothetical protein TB2_035699 [Malus domestica]
MQPRAKSKSWANDAVVAPVAEKIGKSKKESEEKSGAEKIGKTKKESEQKSVLVDMEEAEKGAKKNDKRNVAKDDVVSDMDYFKSRVKTEWSDSESSEEDDNEEEEEEEEEYRKVNEKEQIKVHEEEDGEKGHSEDANGQVIDESNPSSTLKATEEELGEAFSKFGDAQVHLVIDKETNRSKGFAYVLYKLPECAERALEALDGSIFQGRLLHVMPAKQNNPTEKLGADDSASQASKPIKKQREDKRKASEASGDTKAWNSLFMHPDTVIENRARKYGVSKGGLLDREAVDLAVRIALGETQVIAETKKSLTNAGINVEYSENFAAGKTDGVKRSNHVILVKNLPYGSTDGELAKMFGKFGNLEKLFSRRRRHWPWLFFLNLLTLEQLLKVQALQSIEKNTAVVGEHDVKRVMLQQYVGRIADVDADPDRVEVKKHLKNGKNISMGFGFLEFDSVETATNVCRDLQIKSLRLPMKFGQHRGFPFVEFITKQEAENALKALLSTHLYGRHLVLERAKEGESLEELRPRTAAQFADEQNGVSRKRKHAATSDEGKFKLERLD